LKRFASILPALVLKFIGEISWKLERAFHEPGVEARDERKTGYVFAYGYWLPTHGTA
jgi:hypothetical protein